MTAYKVIDTGEKDGDRCRLYVVTADGRVLREGIKHSDALDHITEIMRPGDTFQDRSGRKSMMVMDFDQYTIDRLTMKLIYLTGTHPLAGEWRLHTAHPQLVIAWLKEKLQEFYEGDQAQRLELPPKLC